MICEDGIAGYRKPNPYSQFLSHDFLISPRVHRLYCRPSGEYGQEQDPRRCQGLDKVLPVPLSATSVDCVWWWMPMEGFTGMRVIQRTCFVGNMVLP